MKFTPDTLRRLNQLRAKINSSDSLSRIGLCRQLFRSSIDYRQARELQEFILQSGTDRTYPISVRDDIPSIDQFSLVARNDRSYHWTDEDDRAYIKARRKLLVELINYVKTDLGWGAR